MQFDMNQITDTQSENLPQKILAYSVPGLGKTTFASTFENPFILRTEAGTEAVNMATFPDANGNPMLFEDFDLFMDGLNAFYNGGGGFQTLVIDSADWLERIIHHKVCDEDKVASIADIAYGKGFAKAEVYVTQVIGMLDAIRLDLGVDIVLLAHTDIKQVDPPDGSSFSRYQIKMHHKASALFQEWAGMVLFMNYKRRIIKEEKGFNQKHAISSGRGERIIYTQETNGAFLAKNRVGLPAEIMIGQDTSWYNFHEALNIATDGKYLIPSWLVSSESY